MPSSRGPLTAIIDAFFLMRPVVLVPVWAFVLFGHFRARGESLLDFPGIWQTAGVSVFFWTAVFSLSVGCVYVLNQIADINVDRNNGGLPLLAGGIVSLRAAVITAALSGTISIVLPALAGRAALALFSCGAVALGAIYSFRPFFFSGRPFLDFLTNAFGFGILAFGAGWHLAGRNVTEPAFLLASLPYFLLMCAGAISSTIPDIEGDRAGGKRTTAVLLGAGKAHLLATVFIAAAALCAAAVRDAVAMICTCAALPLYLLQSAWPRRVFAEATYKVGGAASVLAASLLMPLLLAAGGAVFGATWMYFHFRHGLSYPSLVPADRVGSSRQYPRAP